MMQPAIIVTVGLLVGIVAYALIVYFAVTRPLGSLRARYHDQPEPLPDVFPYAMKHLSGAGACGGFAFALSIKPERGQHFRSSDCAHMDGSRIEPCTGVSCDNCGKPFWPLTADVIDLPIAVRAKDAA